MSDPHSSIYLDQVRAEREFAACVLADPAGAVESCSWLSPDLFRDANIGRFWSDVLAGQDSLKAASSCGAYEEILKAGSRAPVLSRPSGLASAIAELAYMATQLESARLVAKAVQKRDTTAVRHAVDCMASALPVEDGYDMSTASVNREFGDMLDGPPVTVRTGILAIDSKIGGIFKDELTLFAGRPGCGKSAVAFYIAWKVASRGQKVILFSLEMDRRLAWARMVCGFGSLEWERVRKEMASPGEIQQLKDEGARLSCQVGDHLLIHDKAYTVHEIHRIASQNKPDLVVVDQLSEINWTDTRARKVDWYGQACKYLRDNVARDKHAALLLIAQLNRKVEERQDKRPTLSDLRDSGELEQRADSVWLGYREDMYDDVSVRQDVVPLEINAAKSRMGKTDNRIVLGYNLKNQSFG